MKLSEYKDYSMDELDKIAQEVEDEAVEKALKDIYSHPNFCICADCLDDRFGYGCWD